MKSHWAAAESKMREVKAIALKLTAPKGQNLDSNPVRNPVSYSRAALSTEQLPFQLLLNMYSKLLSPPRIERMKPKTTVRIASSHIFVPFSNKKYTQKKKKKKNASKWTNIGHQPSGTGP